MPKESNEKILIDLLTKETRLNRALKEHLFMLLETYLEGEFYSKDDLIVFLKRIAWRTKDPRFEELAKKFPRKIFRQKKLEIPGNPISRDPLPFGG